MGKGLLNGSGFASVSPKLEFGVVSESNAVSVLLEESFPYKG